MNTIVYTERFNAAHRVECYTEESHLHGHSYEAVITVTSIDGELQNGMILNQSLLREAVRNATHVLDHRYIVSTENVAEGDPLLSVVPESECAFLGIESSTTEALAAWIGQTISHYLEKHGCRVIHVVLHESATLSAEWFCDAEGGNTDG